MNDQQEQHLKEIIEYFSHAMDKKYRKGQAKHGGDLWERDTLFDALEEAIDLCVYLITEIKKRETAKQALDEIS